MKVGLEEALGLQRRVTVGLEEALGLRCRARVGFEEACSLILCNFVSGPGPGRKVSWRMCFGNP